MDKRADGNIQGISHIVYFLLHGARDRVLARGTKWESRATYVYFLA